MGVKKQTLVFVLSATVVFLIINSESLLTSRDRIKVQETSEDSESKLITRQNIGQNLEKVDLRSSYGGDSPIWKAVENSVHSYEKPIDTPVEEKYYEPVRKVMNILENKTFESARDFIKGFIHSIQENNINSSVENVKSAPKIKPHVSESSNLTTENRNTRMGPTVASRGVPVVTTHLGNRSQPWLESQELPGVGRLGRPVLVVEAGAKVHHNVTWHGFPAPVLTFKILGRLGNTMGVYASLWALGRIYDVKVFMEEGVVKRLRPLFPHLTMSPLPVPMMGASWLCVGAGSPTLTDYTSLQEAAAGLKGPRAIVADGYPFEMQIFNAFRDDLVQEFTFSRKLQQEAQDFLHTVAASTAPTTFVGVHVRRTDFAAALQQLFRISGPGEDYLRRALDFYRRRLPRVTFVVASDDMDYVMEVLIREKDVVFAPGTPPELDLAVLVACNHSVITLGSYGFWAAYLAGGAVVYPDLQPKMNEYSFSRAYYERANLTQFIPLPP
ncbi:uncharacterized protein [Procambarus clarkii]|uniref:uncharacterized protein n=1 Tax=Procambarus clarkii TaxID=6728 RepID=UPI001E6719A2|nr:uncharacterized protein LOC123768844 [Procambarus clarkii]